MDLIGLDINFAAMLSLYEQSFGEPRYRPHWIQQQMLHQGALGRKTGRGFYSYHEDRQEPRPLSVPRPASIAGRLWISSGSWAPGVADLVRGAGLEVDVEPSRPAPDLLGGLLAAGKGEGLRGLAIDMDRSLPPGVPLFVQAVDTTVSETASWLAHPERLVGVDSLFLVDGACATLVAGPGLRLDLREKAERLVEALGRVPLWVRDTPALIAPRVVCTLANEASFAVLERVATPATIDLAMKLGMNHPHGPVEWIQRLDPSRVLRVLDHLYEEYREPRYRASIQLRRWARLGMQVEIPT